jgi:hypothetical protein
MEAFLQACVSPITLPFTVLLILLLVYWITLILGAADIELFDSLVPDMEVDEGGGFFSPLLQLLNIGNIPFIVTLSILVMSGWFFSILANHYFNPSDDLVIALVLLVPNLIVALVITGLITRPLRPLFATETHDKILYRVAVASTSEVTHDFGTVEIETAGVPIVVQARTGSPDTVVVKGDRVLIYDEDPEAGIYFVEPYTD